MAIEESTRELESRLLVAGIAVEHGIAAIIGQQWLLTENLPYLPPGIVLFKGNNTIQHGFMKAARRHGHLVASIEEEALGVARASQILRLYDHDVERTCHLFLAQGEFHRETLVGRYPGAAERIVVVGNPRMDFLRPAFLKALEPHCAEIRSSHGPFVLINTNVADINAGRGDALASYEMCVKTNYIVENDPRGEQDFRDLLTWEHANTREVVRLVRRLRDRSSVTIVIRPHPSERLETWREAFGGRPGIRVVRDGAHLPWTLASEILVHTGCTTGMEAFVAGHAAISLCPGQSQWHDCMVSNRVNPNFATFADAAQFVSDHLARRDPMADRRPHLEAELGRHVAATTGPLSAERLVAALLDYLPTTPMRPAAPVRPKAGFKSRRQGASQEAVKITDTLDDVRARFAEIGRTLDRFGDQRVTELGQSLYQIERLA
jgi:surface carbohydrate biosynthesis protein